MNEGVSDDLTRASELLEDWLARVRRGSAEPFEALLAAYPDLRAELELLHRAEMGMKALDTLGPPAQQDPRSRTRRAAGGHLAPGDVFGDFRIVRELGRGGMGIVFEAEQVSLHRGVALKILPAQLTLNAQALERFQREAEITGRLKHRGIVDIHQVGELDGIHFIVMELVEGTSLDRVIDRMRGESFERVRKVRIADVVSAHGLEEPVPSGTVPPAGEPGSKTRKASSSASNKNYIESSVRLVCQVTDALDHAHRAGVVHRDIKPANILVRADGTPVLTDFGLARETGLPGITVTGAFAGTPNYLSPEQAMAGRVPVDLRSDIFSLGATLYELVTLHYAFEGTNLHEVLGRILSKPPIPAQKHNPALAPDLVTILDKALEKDPDRRYPSAAEFADDLRAFIEYRPIRARRTGTVVRAMRWARREPLKAAFGLVLLVGLPGGTWLWTSAVEARKEVAEKRARLAEVERPDKLEGGFLRLGVGELAEAERAFQEVLAGDSGSQEAAAGLAMTLLGRGRAVEALQWIEEFEATRPEALGRLRQEALLALGQRAAASDLERSLPPPRSATEKYLEAVRLISGRPFVSGLPAESILPLMRSSGKELGAERDALVEYRDRAREAIRLLEDANADENRSIHHFALAWAAWVARDGEVAARYAESIQRKWSGSAVGRFYATLAREVVDPQAALQEYERLLEEDPGLWMARQRRAELFLARQESEQAVEEIRRLVEAFPDRLSFRINLAQVLLRDGQVEAAAQVARDVLDQDRSEADAHDLLGCALYARQDVKGARECFERAVVLDPGRAAFQNHLGWTLVDLGELEKAVECLGRARELDPQDPTVAYNLGLAYLERREHEAALEQFDRGLELLAEAPASRLAKDLLLGARGAALLRLRRLEEAIDSLREALELAPTNPVHHARLGDAAFAAHRMDECLEARERFLQLAPGRDQDHLWLIDELSKRREGSRALAAAKRWTEAHETSARAWNERAWIQADPEAVPPVGDPGDALHAAERAVALSHDADFLCLDTLACAQFASGLVAEAIESAQRALDLADQAGADPEVLEEIEGHLAHFEAAVSSLDVPR